jgi:hypothetical protein
MNIFQARKTSRKTRLWQMFSFVQALLRSDEGTKLPVNESLVAFFSEASNIF